MEPNPHAGRDDVAFGFVLGMIAMFAIFTALTQTGTICGF